MKILRYALMFVVLGCMAQRQTTGELVALDEAFYDYVDQHATIEVLADGYIWSEGPVWVKDGGFLLFSDVPQNTIFKWKEGEGISEFLKPSGYTGVLPYSHEPGSNGLIINQQGELVACEHGDRRVSRMPLSNGGKITIADHWEGKRFNSPNDIVQSSNGTYYFTDPPYGLPEQQNSKTREMDAFACIKLIRMGRWIGLLGIFPAPMGLPSPLMKKPYTSINPIMQHHTSWPTQFSLMAL